MKDKADIDPYMKFFFLNKYESIQITAVKSVNINISPLYFSLKNIVLPTLLIATHFFHMTSILFVHILDQGLNVFFART